MTTKRRKLSKYLKTDILIIELIISLLCARKGEFFTNQSVVSKKSYLILQEYKMCTRIDIFRSLILGNVFKPTMQNKKTLLEFRIA